MKRFPAACAALGLLVSSACAMRPSPDEEPPISERTYAAHSCADLGEAWRRSHFATVLGVEHPASLDLGDGGDRRRYGITAITFFRD